MSECKNVVTSLFFKDYDHLKIRKILGSRLADLHLILPNEVPQLSC